MWKDKKFRLLVFTCIIVGLLETLSIAGLSLPRWFAVPFFLIIIVGIGHQTLKKGLDALINLNFQSINLLMLIAVAGAFYLERYEEAAIVIVLYTLAEKLEDIGIAKSKSALDALMAKMPRKVLIKGRVEERIYLSEVRVGEVYVVKPGDMIALDGEVVDGLSSVDESTITGEPVPKDKTVGDLVFAGTLNNQGYLEIKVTRLVKDSALAKIKELTYQATKSKAQTQKFIEKFSRIYTPLVILLAVGTALIPPLLFGKSFDFWLLEALSLLVIACPCALVISTPISIYSAIGAASQQGVLIKGGRFLEAIGQIKAIALDKTRTLTLGKPKVTDVIAFGNNTKEDLLSCAAGIESYSEHPLSSSIVEAAVDQNYIPHRAENFQSVVGKGVKADCLICEDKHNCIGKLQFILEEHHVPDEVISQIDQLQAEGKTVIIVSTHREVKGIIGMADALRSDSVTFIKRLVELGISPWMLTGDHQVPADVVAKQLNIPEVHAGLLPEQKSTIVAEMLKKYGSVAMLGDGINDAPAMALSTVGITVGSLGSDTAVETASIVLLNDKLMLIPKMIELGRRTLNIIRFNTFWAIAVKVIFVGLALAGMSNLVLAILADVGVTIFVILNSLRLLNAK